MSKDTEKVVQSKPVYLYDKFGDTVMFEDGCLEIEMERDSCCHTTYGCVDLTREETKKLYETMKKYYE